MDIGGGWAILIITAIVVGVILAILRLIGLGIILIILGMIFGVMVGSQNPGAGILMFGILLIVGVLLIRLGVKARRANR